MAPDSLLRFNYGTASVLEIAWTVLGILGLLFTLDATRECLADLAALVRAPTYIPAGARDIVARQNLRNMLQRLIIFCALVLVGVVAMLTPTPNPSVGPSPYGATLAATMILAEFTMVAGAIQDKRDRKQLFYVIRLRRADQTLAESPSTSELLGRRKSDL